MSSNPSAFPIPDLYTNDGIGISEGSPGMTLRDWFAGQALPAVIAAMSAGQHGINPGMSAFESAAHDAYAQADLMLAARAKESSLC